MNDKSVCLFPHSHYIPNPQNSKIPQQVPTTCVAVPSVGHAPIFLTVVLSILAQGMHRIDNEGPWHPSYSKRGLNVFSVIITDNSWKLYSP